VVRSQFVLSASATLVANSRFAAASAAVDRATEAIAAVERKVRARIGLACAERFAWLAGRTRWPAARNRLFRCMFGAGDVYASERSGMVADVAWAHLHGGDVATAGALMGSVDIDGVGVGTGIFPQSTLFVAAVVAGAQHDDLRAEAAIARAIAIIDELRETLEDDQSRTEYTNVPINEHIRAAAAGHWPSIVGAGSVAARTPHRRPGRSRAARQPVPNQ